MIIRKDVITFFFFFFFFGDPSSAKPPHIALCESEGKSMEKYYAEAFSERLKAARQKCSPPKTQKQLASELGLTTNSLCNYEKGLLPSLTNALRLADNLGVSLDYLFARGEYTTHSASASLGSLARILISLNQQEGLQLEQQDTPALVMKHERLAKFFQEYLDYYNALNQQPNDMMQKMFDSWLRGQLNELDGILLETPSEETSISHETQNPLE